MKRGATLNKIAAIATVPASPMMTDAALVLSSPIFFSFELTPVCNNACPGCGNVFVSHCSSSPLSAVQWRDILERLKPHIQRLKLTGGEPTLYPEFESIVNALRELDMPFALFTNARWRDPVRLVTFLRASPHCTGLLVSLHGANAASHDAFTNVPGSFDETCTNTHRAVAAGLNVTTSTVITGYNWREIDDIARLARELGANHAVFNRYLGKPLPQIEPDDAQLRQAIEMVETLRHRGERVKFGNCIPQCFHPSSSTGCLAGIAYCTIDPWGNVRPCNHAPLICGNLLEQSVEEIWCSEAMSRWRDMIVEQCWRCLELPRCHGGCRAIAMLREKDPLVQDPILEKEAKVSDELRLYEGACPIRRYSLRSESFGYVLIRGNYLTPVSAAAKPVLDACDGGTTLLQLRERFGQEALDFVGSLVQKGLIELK